MLKSNEDATTGPLKLKKKKKKRKHIEFVVARALGELR